MKFRTLLRSHQQNFATISALVMAGAACIASNAQAADLTWKTGVGNFNVATNWTPENVPGTSSTDVAKINNTGNDLGGTTVNYVTGDNFTFASLELAPATAQNNNRSVFNQTGGTLSVENLRVGVPNSGASKSPEYRISGGTLNISNTWSFGNGSAIKFLASGGVVNFTNPSNNYVFTLGYGGVTHELALSNNAVVNYNSPALITFGGSTANSVAKISLSGTSLFNAPDTEAIRVGNSGSKGNTITLSDSAIFSAPKAAFALGQWNEGSPDAPTAAGTLTLGGTSQFKALQLKTGGNNAGNPQWGVINLNGGTIETGAITNGASTTPATVDRNVLHANGGTVKAITHSTNTNFFQGVFVNLQSGGLKFDTNSIAEVTITNPLNGTGGLTKQGVGTLTLTGANTYTGTTSVTGGTLKMTTATLSDTAALSVTGTGKIDLAHGGIDVVGSLTFGTTTGTNGTTYGSTASGADVQNDTYFAGTGMIAVGSAPSSNRTLRWTAASGATWSTGPAETFVDTATNLPTNFRSGDHVVFNNTTSSTITVNLGTVQPGSITIQGGGWEFASTDTVGAITGTGNVTSSAVSVLFGGTSSTFTGNVTIQSGTFRLTRAKSLGNSANVTVQAGAQLDLNGRGTGATPGHNFTIAGAGPDGNGALVDTSNSYLIENVGIKRLTLTGNATVSSVNRFDLGTGNITDSIVGNGYTLTKKGAGLINIRAEDNNIHYVIEQGRMFVENYGTFGSSLLIKGGAAAGSYGDIDITADTVMVEDGGMIYNQGLGPARWNSYINATGTFTVENVTSGATEVGGPERSIQFLFPVTGDADLVKIGQGRVDFGDAPGWTGNTSIRQGTVSLLWYGDSGLSDTGLVNIASGAQLLLDYDMGAASDDEVAGLILAGTGQTPGTYGSAESLATNKSTAFGTISLGVLKPTGNAASVWVGNGSDSNWSTGQNWTSGAAPVQESVLEFRGPNRLVNTNNLPADSTFGGLTFAEGAGAFTLSGQSITLNGELSNKSSNTQIITFPMVFGEFASVDTGAQDLTLGNIASGPILRKAGTGTLTLGASTTVDTLTLGAQSLGGVTKVPAGGSLQVGNGAAGQYVLVGGSLAGNSNTYAATLDASESASFTANVPNFYVSHTPGGSPPPTPEGNLHLGANNSITASSRVWIGHSGNQPLTKSGTVTTADGGQTTIKSPVVTISTGKSSGALTLGNASTVGISGIDTNARTALEVGNNTIGTSTSFTSTLDASAGILNAKLSRLIIGNNAINGSTTSSVTIGTNTANHLDIEGNSATSINGATGSAVVYIGRSTGGSGVGTGTLTIGNLDSASTISSNDNGTAILIANAAAAEKAVGTLNLNGGTLTIKTTGTAISGGALGTSTVNFNGTTLRAGATSSTWIQGLTSAVVGTGGAKIDTNSFNLTIPQVLSGTGGFTKLGAGQLTLSATSGGYAGATSVNAGTLSLKASLLSNTAAVNIATGATLNLDFAGTDTVASLTVGGTGRAPGTYTAVGNAGAGEIADAAITGTGKLLVTSGSGGGNAYTAWANLNNLTGVNAEASEDPDFDGIPNGIEFVTGSDPQDSSQSDIPEITRDASGNLVFSFWRTAASVAFDPHVEYSTTLTPTWSRAQNGQNGVSVTVVPGVGGGRDRVTVTLPQGLAAGGKLFARLRVEVTN